MIILGLIFYCQNTNDLPNNQRLYTNIINEIIINNCYFSRFSLFQGNSTDINSPIGNSGGIIFVYDKSIHFLIFESIFFNCSATGFGGCIYLYCNLQNSTSNFKKICVNNCWSYWYSFAFIGITNSINNLNSYNLLSINYCFNKNTISSRTLEIVWGNITVNNLNSTKNQCTYFSGLLIIWPSYSFCKFNLFFNNTVQENVCIYLNGNHSNFFEYNQLLFNNSPLKDGIIAIMGGLYTFSNCLFKQNQNHLFYIRFE